MTEQSSAPEIKAAQKDYFGACALMICVAIAGFVKPAVEMSKGLAIFLFATIIAVGGAYFHFRKKLEEDIALPQTNSRLQRMAILWYALSVVLGVALVRDPILETGRAVGGDASALEWTLAVAGASAIALALFRLFKLIWGRVRR